MILLGSWVEIENNVCVGSRGDHIKGLRLNFHKPVLIGGMMLSHTQGEVGCHSAAKSFWECAADDVKVNMHVTDLKNQPIYPSARFVHKETGGWYSFPGYTSSSPHLVFTDVGYPKYFKNGDLIRIWYGEVLFNFTEGDNHGYTCMNVFAYVLTIW